MTSTTPQADRPRTANGGAPDVSHVIAEAQAARDARRAANARKSPQPKPAH